MFEAYSAGNDEVGSTIKVDWDNRIVGFGMRDVVLVVDDAAVFSHFEFVTVPIGTHTVAFVLGDILDVEPESVVDGFVVDKGAGGIVGIEGEGNQQARGDLSAKPHVEMLFQVADGHQVTHFGVG